ncbi:hypothetical protein [Streptomyces niveus]|uniref:hypothetical protein n=1 Tax=Streptomyces niveus TaxID=193462 RepID=UPI003657E9B9
MGLWPTVLISLVFPALMLLVTVALGRMEEFLLPHLRAPLPADADAPSDQDTPPAEDDPAEDIEAEPSRAEKIRIAQARADAARRARRRAYGPPRPVGRTNTGPPRGARTTPLRFR